MNRSDPKVPPPKTKTMLIDELVVVSDNSEHSEEDIVAKETKGIIVGVSTR
jgi:hypothetical protein